MSRTEKKNGIQVQRAIYYLSAQQHHAGLFWVKVGEVAKEAEVSKPTALKYLKILQGHGLVQAIELQGAARLFCWNGDVRQS